MTRGGVIDWKIMENKCQTHDPLNPLLKKKVEKVCHERIYWSPNERGHLLVFRHIFPLLQIRPRAKHTIHLTGQNQDPWWTF